MYYATADEMERLDELAVESGLEIKQMMELAGWQMVNLFSVIGVERKSKVVVVVGKGNKGGDGLCAARHLVNHGFEVDVVLVSREIKTDSRHQLKLLEKMKVKVLAYAEDKERADVLIATADVLIDALIGYQLDGSPRGDFSTLVKLMNRSGGKVIAYDLPTGMESSTGECLDPCIKADMTLTLALPKKAFDSQEGRARSGDVYLADIGIPAFLYEQIGAKRPEFGRGKKQLLKI